MVSIDGWCAVWTFHPLDGTPPCLVVLQKDGGPGIYRTKTEAARELTKFLDQDTLTSGLLKDLVTNRRIIRYAQLLVERGIA